MIMDWKWLSMREKDVAFCFRRALDGTQLERSSVGDVNEWSDDGMN